MVRSPRRPDNAVLRINTCSDISARGLDAPARRWHASPLIGMTDTGTAARAGIQGGNMPSKTFSQAGILAAAAIPAQAQTPEQFFKGKTLTFYVGLSPGGGYDQNARLVAKYFGKYVPGNPTVVVKNMPGGGGLVMTNSVANVM